MKIINKRMAAVFTIVLAVYSVLFVRLFYLQVWNHQKLQQLVEQQVIEKKIQNPFRGIIYDRNKHTLAMNVKSYSFSANPGAIQDKNVFSRDVARMAGISSNEVLKKISKDSNFVWIKRQVPADESKNVEQVKIDGLVIQKETKRYYPYKNLTSQIVGVVGIDGQGLSGIEYLYDNLVKQKKVTEIFNRDGLKHELRLSSEKNLNSPNIVLSIDTTLQYIASRELENAVKKYRPANAYVIIQDPKNGEILAVANYPNFDPNVEGFTSEDLIIPPIHKVYEPGSTFKVVTAAAALAENKFNMSDVVFCENGSYKYQDIEINDHEKYGYLSLEGIMAYSSNIGFAKVGIELGREKIYYWMKQFGFGNYTGSSIPGEQKGLVFNPFSSRWSMVSALTISFGQGIGVTGLQLINAYSSIANGGILYEPQIVKSIIDNNDKVMWSNKPRVIREVLPVEITVKLKKMLRDVVDYGTGKLAGVEGYTVCGKTGTAQKIDPKTKKYSTSKYVASFCGFLPAEDPQLTILVVLDEPKSNYWASDVACPVFSHIAKESINYLNIPKIDAQGARYDLTKLTY
ncbi:MAG: penicillin-binding protein 2 [Elusimicrobia bacterium]|nr:penicillin-binding protein 2 [Elusimicrobiota bacterium]MBU2614518.1 penicillin-binding protein 2 [Elusimicrobiota bacterium]